MTERGIYAVMALGMTAGAAMGAIAGWFAVAVFAALTSGALAVALRASTPEGP